MSPTSRCRSSAERGEASSAPLVPLPWAPARELSNSSTAAKALLHCMSAATSSASREAESTAGLPPAAAATMGDSRAAALGVASQAVSASASAVSSSPWGVGLAATGAEKAWKQAASEAWMGM